ncbi:hypothetical protein [Natrinema hispanicum]|nr:hypothetical protein [Natrinema hispanicum]
MTVTLRLLEELHNNGAPAFVTGAGNPDREDEHHVQARRAHLQWRR